MINIVRQYDRDHGTRKVKMPKNPEEVAKPSIGKVICTRGKMHVKVIIYSGLGFLSQNLYE